MGGGPIAVPGNSSAQSGEIEVAGRYYTLCGRASDREQPLEELSVTPQGETKILRGGVLASSPLRLEPRARLGETCRELFDDLRDEGVGLLDTLRGVVDESRLDIVPARAQP